MLLRDPSSLSWLPLRRGLLPLLLLLAVWVGAPGARADAADFDAVTTNALEEYQRGRYEEALALFSVAHEMEPSARTLRGKGYASFELRRYVDALVHLRAALVHPNKPLTPELRQQAEELIQKAETFVTRVRFRLEPADAELRVDGRLVAVEGPQVLLDPGLHQVVVSAEGHETAVRSVQWSPGAALELRISLVRHAAAVPTGLEAQAHPQPEAPSGADAPEAKSRAWFRLKYAALGTLVAAGALTGVALHQREQRAQRVHPQSREACAEDPACRDALAQGRSWRKLAIAGGALGTVSAALAVASFVLDRDREQEPPAAQARGACLPELEHVGLHCQLSF